MRELIDFENITLSTEVIVSYDIHYEGLRADVRNKLKEGLYQGVAISESTYLLSKLNKTRLHKLREELRILHQKYTPLRESDSKKTVKIIIILPGANDFLFLTVVDQVVLGSITE